MRLAMLEMRVVLSLLVRKFDFAPATGAGSGGLEQVRRDDEGLVRDLRGEIER